MTRGAARTCGLLRRLTPKRPPPVLSRGQQSGKRQRVTLAHLQEGFHTPRGPSGGPARPAPPPGASVPARPLFAHCPIGTDAARGGGVGAPGRRTAVHVYAVTSRVGAPVGLRFPAAFLPLPWVRVGLVRNLQLLFRSPSSPAAGIGLRDEEEGCGGLKAVLLHSLVRAWISFSLLRRK